jgi:hypothetical protein
MNRGKAVFPAFIRVFRRFQTSQIDTIPTWANASVARRNAVGSGTISFMSAKRNPWDQRPNEPDKAYVRFLVFRNLGPGRTLDRAYREFGRDNGTVSEGTQRRAPGRWRFLSTTFDWFARARQWDIATLTEHGQDAVMAFVHTLSSALQKVAGALENLEGPPDWATAIESLVLLASLIPPETVAAVMAAAATTGDEMAAAMITGDEMAIAAIAEDEPEARGTP